MLTNGYKDVILDETTLIFLDEATYVYLGGGVRINTLAIML